MTGLNIKWAISELDKFIDESADLPGIDPDFNAMSRNGSEYNAKMAMHAAIVEPILDRATPNWRETVKASLSTRWQRLREAAIRAREQLSRTEELRQNLGDDAPELSAAKLHPWIWSGAQSLWQSGHFRSAVEDAAKKLNAETQNKLGRRDLSEAKLFQDAYSDKPPVLGKPRLRRMKDDGSNTYKSMQRGAMALAEGIYAGIRNPFNHETPMDIDEQVGLEYLAALSVLARWVDESTLEVARE